MRKYIFTAISILLIGLFFLGRWAREKEVVMDIPVLSAEETETLIGARTPFADSVQVQLRVNETAAPFEMTEERYYISKNMAEDHYKGTLDATADGIPISAAWVSDEAWDDLSAAISEGHEFSCLLYSDREYELVKVLFTGLPVMSIDGTMGEEGTRITLLDPIFSVNSSYEVQESLAYYNIRGNASKRFEKIGYRLELFYDDGSSGKDLSLLGMRSDNDWQLKALYSDRSKIRDKLSIELWNQIADQSDTQADTGCRMEYLELIINGEYRGIYGLVELTDYKSLGLSKTRDIIYKVKSDEWPDDELFDASEAEQSFTCAGVKIRQAGRAYTAGLWEPFRIFWDSGYEMESEEDLEMLYSCIDRQNFIDYALYYNAIAGMDNRFKNIIYSTVLNTDGSYTIRRIPWDQNYSWGDDFETGEDKDIKNIRFNYELTSRWLNETVFSQMQEYDEGLSKDMYETWKNWRSTFLSEDYWKSYAREQMAYLVESGAFARDTAKWPDSENVEGTDEIESYIDARFIWLDQYLEALEE